MYSIEFRGISVVSVGLLAILLGGCAAAPEDVRPTVQSAVASNASNTYVIKRASVRTPASDLGRRSAVQAVRQHATRASSVASRQPTASQSSTPAMTREQYHARYEAELRARQEEAKRLRAAKAEAEKRQKLAKAEAAGQQAKTDALRRGYQAEWDKKQADLKAKRAVAKVMEKRVENVIGNAKQQIGTKYVWGGASPSTGFDCSGLVQHSLRQGANVRVPRTAAEQYQVAVKVAKQQALRGDLVFFRTRGNAVSHVGIYLGGGRFLHAPSTGKTVTTSAISGYWQERLVGFGRIPGACRVPLPV